MTDPSSRDDELDLRMTAYQSGSEGLWTVWDHVNDREVRSGISEAEAREIIEHQDDDEGDL